MRHRKNTVRLGRSSAHHKALVSSLVCNFIQEQRIKTTLPKARQARSLAEKMVTLAKVGTLAARRQVAARLRDDRRVAKLFADIAPQFKDRAGGYTRILKLGRRGSDSSEMVLLEWVGLSQINRKRKEKEEAAPDKKATETVPEKKPTEPPPEKT